MNNYSNFRFFYNSSDYSKEHLLISDAMGYESNPNFSICRDYFDNYLVMYVLKGTLIVEQYGIKKEIASGNGILLSLKNPHKYYFKKNTNTHIVWFHFNGFTATKWIFTLTANNKLPYVYNYYNAEKDIYELFELTKQNSKYKEYEISVQIYKICLKILETPLYDTAIKFNPDKNFIDSIDQYILNNISEKISLADMSKNFSFSKYHFCRKFKNIFKTTPFNYITEMKINIAKKILTESEDSVASIAQFLGFYDQGYFSNTFKAKTGCSPNAFRKKSVNKKI